MEQQNNGKKKSNIVVVIVLVVICLLIVPAIIIGVMLVSTGILIYNRGAQIASEPISLVDQYSNGSTDSGVADYGNSVSQFEAVLIQAYNSSYEQYEGEGRPYSVVKSLMSLISRNEKNEDMDYPEVVVEYIDVEGNTNSIEAVADNDARKTYKYNIEIDGHDASGYVNHITITEVKIGSGE